MLTKKYPKTIYAIMHNATGKIYIGSTTNMKNRYQVHLETLRSNKHHVEDMQQDFNEYGEDLSLITLEVIKNKEDDKGNEYKWMDRFQTTVRGIGYNYKDNHAASVRNKTITRKKLEKLLNKLSDNQQLYVYSFLTKIFGEE